jgi:hypothetical protein
MRNVPDNGATRAAAWLSAWDSQGIHRTATAGDDAGAAWLMREAAGLGAAPAAEDFALDRLDPVAAYFECDGERIPGVPVFDSPGMGAEGIAGILERIAGPLAGQPRNVAAGSSARLESLRALIAYPPLCDVIFTANSGHELGHLGLDEFMIRRPGWEPPVAAGGAIWVHYGANIGAVGGELSMQSAGDDLRTLTAAQLARAGQPHQMTPKTLVPSGETRDIHRVGGCYVTLVGSNPLFHLPQDRWPHAVDAGAVGESPPPLPVWSWR